MYVVEQTFFVFHDLKEYAPSPYLTRVWVHGWALERILVWLYEDSPGLTTVLKLRSVFVRCGQSLSQSDDIVPTPKLPLLSPPGGPLVPALLTHKWQLSAGIK